MRVLDLFCGLKGWSQAFEDRGHEVITVDILEKFNPTICANLDNIDAEEIKYQTGINYFDVILASPPCNNFSIASVYRHWTKGYPNPETIDSIKLVGNTLKLIMDFHPKYWVMENPRGMMRRVMGKPYVTTFFAAWQTEKEREDTKKAFHDKRKPSLKPTDLWGVHPKIKWEKPKIWEPAPRGSKMGIQGVKDKELRAKIPYGLSLAFCKAIEKELNDNKIPV